MKPLEDLRRRIPQIARLFEEPAVKAAAATSGRAVVEGVMQAEVASLRAMAAAQQSEAFEQALETLGSRIAAVSAQVVSHSLRRVINATGVVVHTNLGRAPLSPEAAAHVAAVASSYSNLEFDLEKGDRGNRESHAEERLRAMLAAEGSVVVNNNAAAVLLAVNTFAEGREVLVSRGELVEIGGSFRIPEILGKGGAQLREVGTTNRTRIADFKNAITAATGLILRVHPSNFRIVGFTESASLAELVALGRERSVPVVEDLGSGLLDPMSEPLHHEATIGESLASGVDVVTASGDKLLGGPQAGLLIGRREATDALRRNPLYRALRVDKMTIAALDAALALHQSGRGDSLPVPRMLRLPLEEIRSRVERLRARLLEGDCAARIEARETVSAVGGGAAPDLALKSFALAVSPRDLSPDGLARKLRHATPPIIARIEDDAVLFDLRTVLPGEDDEVQQALNRILSGSEDS